MDTQNNNNQTSLVIKRQVQVEAVSKAIYLITDLFEKDEPLKMSLRRSAVGCIENSGMKESFLKLISLVKLSKDLSLISDMNADIILNVLNHKVDDLDKKDELGKTDIKLDDIIEDIYYDKSSDTVNNNGEVKEVAVPVPTTATHEKKGLSANTSITIHNNTQTIKTINNISMDIGSRRKRILEIVKTRGAVTINEFMDSIKGCSSKTIQRELTSLVLSGTLKKTGERRWSKYSLK